MSRAGRCVFVLLGLIAMRSASADVVFEHPPRAVAGQTSVGYFSDNRPTLTGVTSSLSADNFTLASGANVASIRWWGSPAYPAFPPPSSTHQDITAYRLQLYADAASPGRPGSLLQDVLVPLSSVAFASTGDMILDRTIYQYEAALPAEWALAGGTQYWLCVSAEITVLNSSFRWTWRRSDVFDHWSAVYGPPRPNAWASLAADDLAFSLLGTVPAPGSAMALLGAGVIASRRQRVTH